MNQLAYAQTVEELKINYRKLAALHHPDRGGKLERMQTINNEYHRMLRVLSKSTNCAQFENVSVSDKVYVNGTECEVIAVSEKHFRVVAKGRTRQAVFDKKTGMGMRNRRLKASYCDTWH